MQKSMGRMMDSKGKKILLNPAAHVSRLSATAVQVRIPSNKSTVP